MFDWVLKVHLSVNVNNLHFIKFLTSVRKLKMQKVNQCIWFEEVSSYRIEIISVPEVKGLKFLQLRRSTVQPQKYISKIMIAAYRYHLLSNITKTACGNYPWTCTCCYKINHFEFAYNRENVRTKLNISHSTFYSLDE